MLPFEILTEIHAGMRCGTGNVVCQMGVYKRTETMQMCWEREFRPQTGWDTVFQRHLSVLFIYINKSEGDHKILTRQDNKEEAALMNVLYKL